ncbi:MAG TPA: hypothetical protein VNU01_04490, partial [Egibacteraceae bacterium]|nr:hypothetical protein [Egibacteraceae bacterium]
MSHPADGQDPMVRVAFGPSETRHGAVGGAVAHVESDTVVELSRVVPLLESAGFAVVTHTESRHDGATRHSFTLRAREGAVEGPGDARRLAAAVEACWHGWCEVDALNALVLTAGVDWRDVAVLRAYRHYHRHLASALSGRTIDAALLANPAVAACLVAYFRARFDGTADAAAAGAWHARAEVGHQAGGHRGVGEQRRVDGPPAERAGQV